MYGVANDVTYVQLESQKEKGEMALKRYSRNSRKLHKNDRHQTLDLRTSESTKWNKYQEHQLEAYDVQTARNQTKQKRLWWGVAGTLSIQSNIRISEDFFYETMQNKRKGNDT